MSKNTNPNEPATKPSTRTEKGLAVDAENIKAGLPSLDQLHDSMTNNLAKAPVTDNPGGSCKKGG